MTTRSSSSLCTSSRISSTTNPWRIFPLCASASAVSQIPLREILSVVAGDGEAYSKPCPEAVLASFPVQSAHHQQAPRLVILHQPEDVLKRHVRSCSYWWLTGNWKVNRLPLPGADSTAISPPYWWTICWTMARPSPVPTSPLALAWSLRKNS